MATRVAGIILLFIRGAIYNLHATTTTTIFNQEQELTMNGGQFIRTISVVIII